MSSYFHTLPPPLVSFPFLSVSLLPNTKVESNQSIHPTSTSFLFMCIYKCEYPHTCIQYIFAHTQTHKNKEKRDGNRILKITPQNTYTCTWTYGNFV